jgi:hypothetical protein
VVQFNYGDCTEPSRVYLEGIIANVNVGPRYEVSWDYLYSEHYDHVWWKSSVSISRDVTTVFGTYAHSSLLKLVCPGTAKGWTRRQRMYAQIEGQRLSITGGRC